MKQRHEIAATHDISRKYNDLVNVIDYIVTYMLKNVSQETGEPIYTDVATLKTELANWGVSLKELKTSIATFISKRQITFDLSQYIDKNLIALNTDLATIDNFLTKTVTDIEKLNTLAKIATAAATIINPTVNVSAVNYDTETHKTNSINSLLDASSYVLHDINPEDGTVLNWTDEQKKQRVQNYLNQIPLKMSYVREETLLADCMQMKSVADFVLANLDTVPLNDLGTYIDTNVAKLPLLRRNWA